jgi:hypothetical protein
MARKTKLTPALIVEIVAAIHRVLIMRHVAWSCGVHYTRLYAWLRQGEDDDKEEKDTIHRDLLYALRLAQTEKIAGLLDIIADRKANWQSNAWILERCFREDFGSDGAEMKELSETLKKLCEDVQRIKSSPTVGTIAKS